MKTFVQFKDGVAFAHVTTQGPIDTTDMIEVECSGHSHLGQIYDNGEWIDAPVYTYAILDDLNTVVQILQTVYSSEIKGPIIKNSNVKINWVWNGEDFVPPVQTTLYQPIIEPILINDSTPSQEVIDAEEIKSIE